MGPVRRDADIKGKAAPVGNHPAAPCIFLKEADNAYGVSLKHRDNAGFRAKALSVGVTAVPHFDYTHAVPVDGVCGLLRRNEPVRVLPVHGHKAETPLICREDALRGLPRCLAVPAVTVHRGKSLRAQGIENCTELAALRLGNA